MEQKNISKSSNTAQVLILGTYHFDKGGSHAVDVDIKDVTTDEKQAEIIEVVNKLANFRPTKIVLEAAASSSEELNVHYLKYCSKEQNITSEVIAHRNEIVQLGFRLAAQLNHTKVYPIDVSANLPFEPLIASAEKDHPELHKNFFEEINKIEKEINDLQKNATVSEILQYLNNPKRIAMEHSNLYLTLNQVGAGDTYHGANLLSAWYDRNIRMFANLQSITEPEDRILVIYGGGHAAILKEFVSSYSKMQLVDTMQYL